MAKVYNNRIETTAGYTLNSETPIDDRLSVETLNDLSVLISNGFVYDNMIVGVKDKGIYKYNKSENKWIRQAIVKTIVRDGSSIEVLDEELDNNSVATINIVDKSITSDKIADESISEDKLSTNFTKTLIRGTAGTSPMNEGEYLAAGTIYIQYDESI